MEQRTLNRFEVPRRQTRSKNKQQLEDLSHTSSTRKSPRHKKSPETRLAKYDEAYHQARRKKVKLNPHSETEQANLSTREHENSIEAGSTAEQSQDDENSTRNGQEVSTKRKLKKLSEQKRKTVKIEEEKELNHQDTQTELGPPIILKTFFDEKTEELYFQIQEKGKIVEVHRDELMLRHPLLMLYFYEMHIEFSNPANREPISLAPLETEQTL